MLEVLGHGFPLLPVGVHRVEGDLPTVFHDVHPSGYLGRRFVRAHPQMGLPADPTRWQRDQILRVLTEAGHDLAGNLVVGEERWRRFQQVFGRGDAPGPTRVAAPSTFGRFVDDDGLAMVRALAARLEGGAAISRAFVALWRRGAAASLG